ncbi:cold shock CspA family protein [Streptomyces griseochromogenes]|uniref:Cold shock CspA family protein n=1 Tax=Streptomyces griseochromogenes TaxID=68214 RepID=A0A1B1AW75_9ACTN|nr:cold shock domain-containing protein [Streptomyces griseochromogenes]ANP50834.1 DNA-binding protein [Streptomyces griseochromogenes]MBP2056680.1 cold shock CspA family protein [Streptomyces griseochromogenes]
MRSGRILKFDEIRGYGFIAQDNSGEDVFVHLNDFVEGRASHSPGTPVEFEVTEGERGLKAFSVRVVEQRSERPSEQPYAKVRASGPADDTLCDVLSRDELLHEITESLLANVPTLTGAQIAAVRDCLVKSAHEHGWLED